ncbi:hypothetical protein OHB56_01695 [Streptomyces sp. NBC_01635]|uniref:hypothetical protein n=1 Tax=Streptomyces sp. NBC_01635 TaxID=2975904 RepID=UPI003862E612|nr:hypothetical protein OHB56_01695 [Streptomyces sp. NBC_01635]
MGRPHDDRRRAAADGTAAEAPQEGRATAASPVADTPPARYDDPWALVTHRALKRPPQASNTQEPIGRAVRTVDHDSATGDRTRHSPEGR